MKQIAFIILFIILYTTQLAGQSAVVKIFESDISPHKLVPLEKSLWKYMPGDNIQWAQPSYKDNSWASSTINFDNNTLPPQWKGYGWFRIWIKKDSKLSLNTWGLRINHDGASQIFWDGKKIDSIGRFATNADSIKIARAPYAVFPVAITDTMPHLLAIRYANFKPVFDDFAGFQVWIGDMNSMNQKAKSDQRFYDFLLISVGIQAMLVLLHLLLFVFYPRQKINVYYSAFVFVLATAALTRYLTISTTSPGMQYACYKVFTIMITLIPFTSALMFYQVSFNRIPKKRLIIIALPTIAMLIYVFLKSDISFITSNSRFTVFTNILTAAVFIDGTIVITKAIKKGNKLLWLIAIAICLDLIASIVVGTNLFGWFTFYQVMATMALVGLLLPILFSIYLAINVATTNRTLETQLTTNKKLSEENLAQEQEKNKLISDQADKLEQTVLERTAEVRRQADKLREMDEQKSRFFVNLTHEFKTPLTLIINPAKELLQNSNEVLAKQYAGFILQNSERLLQLINQLLDLSKLENGQLDINTEPVEMVQWLNNYMQQHHSLAAQKNIELSFTSTVAQLWAHVDIDKMEKMVQNLLSNAIKFSGTNGHVSVQFDKPSEQNFTILVADTGIGIPSSKLPYIFDRFYQADASDTRSREGAGIGLALTKELAELLGGDITVLSEQEKGSLFVLTLPYNAATPVNKTSPAIIQSLEKTSNTNETVTAKDEDLPMILVVEDNASLRDFIVLSFAENFNIITAQNGEEGIQTALEKIPLLIITDLMMPEMNGYQLCDTLKNDTRTSHIPIVMLTALADQDSRIQGIQTGADAYLAKPFDKRELLAVTDNLIKIRQQLREKYGKDNIWLTSTDQLPSIEQTFLNEVRSHIEKNIDDAGYGADQLSADMALSRTQLHRKLKQLINQSPGELMRSIRLQRAYELLQNNIATIAEVGYMVGYANPANFSTSFSKHFGHPPSEVSKTKA